MGNMNIVQPLHSMGDGESYDIGIVKNKCADIYFEQFPQNYLAFDNFTYTAPYQLLPGATATSTLGLLSNVIDENAWRSDLLEPITEILKQANAKRQELNLLLMHNPHLPYHKSHSNCAMELHYRIQLALKSIPTIGNVLAMLGSVVIGFPLLIIGFCQYFLYYCLDILLCRLQPCRAGTKETQFLQEIIQKHPELSTEAIDKEITDQLTTLLKEVLNKHSQLKIALFVGQEQVIDNKNNDFYMQDYFLLRIEKSGSVKTDENSMV